MKIELDNDRQITFQKTSDEGRWCAKIKIKNLDTEFEFSENIFSGNNNDIQTLNYKHLQFVINKIILQLDEFKNKAENVLKSLHIEIFKNEFEENQAYFDLVCVELLKINESIISDEYIYYSFRLIYSLESKIDDLYVLDPYYAYFAKFVSVTPNHIVLSSVSREGL